MGALPIVVPFNKASTSALERRYVAAAMRSGRLAGDGPYTLACQRLVERRYGYSRALLTTSCSDALELAALLANIGPGDEVIVPSFTFVSTANAFALRGARIVFADSSAASPNIDVDRLEALVTPRTRVLVVVHYAGIACDMRRIMALAARTNLMVVEDAAQALDSNVDGRPVGSFGACAAFSFHETKNLSCGEGGMLVLNDPSLFKRAEILREKGTNRSAYFRGEVDRYGWVDVGSSFLPSELNAACLLGQLERIDVIQAERMRLFDTYQRKLAPVLGEHGIGVPHVPPEYRGNAHAFYIVLPSLERRTELIACLANQGIKTAFHYDSLHRGAYFQGKHDGRRLEHSDRYSDCLLRLPMFLGMRAAQQALVIRAITAWVHSTTPN